MYRPFHFSGFAESGAALFHPVPLFGFAYGERSLPGRLQRGVDTKALVAEEERGATPPAGPWRTRWPRYGREDASSVTAAAAAATAGGWG